MENVSGAGRWGRDEDRDRLYLLAKDTVLPLDATDAFVSPRPSEADPSILPKRASEPFDARVALRTERALGTDLHAIMGSGWRGRAA